MTKTSWLASPLPRVFVAALLCIATRQATAAPSANAGTARRKLLVMPSKPEQGLSQGSAALLDEIMSSELSKDPRFEVVSIAEVTKLMQVDALKQQAGCDADSCLAEIGGALGADYLVNTTLGQLGNSFVVTVKLMFVREGRVQRWTETVPAKEDVLADAVRRAVHQILPAETTSHTASLALAGVGAATAATGGLLGYLSLAAVQQRNAALADSATYTARNASAQGLATGTNVMWGVTGAVLVTAVIVFIVEARR